MSTRDPRRQAASYRAELPEPAFGHGDEPQCARPESSSAADDQRHEAPGRCGATGDASPSAGGPPRAVGRMQERASWVDHLIDQAIRRGDFDDLPLAGKPIPDLGSTHDPDWWLKGVVRREHLSGEGLLPEALALRAEDERMQAKLDRMRHEDRVRAALIEFNARVVSARRQLTGGPPVLTPVRDVEAEVAAWRERRAAHLPDDAGTDRSVRRARRWWRRG